MTKMLQLSDKDLKAPMIKYFNKELWTQLKQMRKSLSKDIEGIKENQVEIL